MASLPVDGQVDWGDQLNQVITDLQTNVTGHEANSPSDPHGDRAYAQSLVTPITAGVNQANGFVKLNSSGQVPPGLIQGQSGAGGSFTNVYDVFATFGAIPNNGADQSGPIQNALNACASAGGGEVWVPAGVFSLANYVTVGANTWLHLSEGATLQRIVGTSTPNFLVTNCFFGTSATPAATNIMISGGTIDAVGAGLHTSCTPVFIIRCAKVTLRDTIINNVFNNPAVELNACSQIRVESLVFSGAGASSGSPSVPALRLNQASTSTTPSGLNGSVYNNAVCTGVTISGCGTAPKTTSRGNYGSLAGSDLTGTFASHTNITLSGCYTSYNSQGPGDDTLSTFWSNYAEGVNAFFDSGS